MGRRIKKDPNKLRVKNIVILLSLLALAFAIFTQDNLIKWKSSKEKQELKPKQEENRMYYLTPDASNPALDEEMLDWAAQTLGKLYYDQSIVQKHGSICLKIGDGLTPAKFFVFSDQVINNENYAGCNREDNWEELYREDEQTPFTVWVQPLAIH